MGREEERGFLKRKTSMICYNQGSGLIALKIIKISA